MRVALWLLLSTSPVAADAPSGYQCSPGKPKAGVGCDCPAGYLAKRGKENTAVCAVAAPIGPVELWITEDDTGADVVGARVVIDDKLERVYPAYGQISFEVKPGRHKIDVFKDGASPYSKTVQVDAGKPFYHQVAIPRGSVTSAKGCATGMVAVRDGELGMGSDADGRHTVHLKKFCIDRTEVTVKSYAACVAAGSCTAAKPPGTDASQFCNGNRSDRQDHPVNCVAWDQAAAFCTWSGKRLPTEAEWEFAARSRASNLQYVWGNEQPTSKHLNACGSECATLLQRTLKLDGPPMYRDGDGWETTAPSGRFPLDVSRFGILDMGGNVREWTADWYGPYPKEMSFDPTGAKTGTQRVSRGGAWSDRTTDRVSPTRRYQEEAGNQLGFRCVAPGKK